MFFILGVGLISDCFLRIEIPVGRNRFPRGFDANISCRRNRTNSHIGSEVRSRKGREPSCDVFFLEFGRFVSNENQRFEDRAPADAIFLTSVEKVMRANGSVASSRQRSLESKAIGPSLQSTWQSSRHPSVETMRRRSKSSESISRQRISEVTNQLKAVVEASVPSQDSARRPDMRLSFILRFFGGMERAPKEY